MSGNSVDTPTETVLTEGMTRRCNCGARLEPRVVCGDVKWICPNGWNLDGEHFEVRRCPDCTDGIGAIEGIATYVTCTTCRGSAVVRS